MEGRQTPDLGIQRKGKEIIVNKIVFEIQEM
jgi:hypothetical protein